MNGTASTPVTENGTTYYSFSCELPAKHMTDEVTATLYKSNVKTAEVKYSIQKYGQTVLSNTSSSSYTVDTDVVKAMLNYGAACQTYFNYNTSSLANSIKEMNEADKSVVDTVKVETMKDVPELTVDGELPTMEYYGTSVLFTSATKLRHYFEITGLSGAGFTCTAGDKTLAFKKSGDLYYVEQTDITAKNLNTLYTFTINEGDHTMTIASAVNSYLKDILLNYGDGENIVTVAKAMYLYGNAAEKHFNCTHTDTTITVDMKAATCTEDGYSGDTYCTKCGQTIAKGHTLTKLGHTESTKDVIAATCTTAGYTGDTYCTRCNENTKTGSTIDALGHSYTGSIVSNNNGVHKTLCANGCGTYSDAANCTYTLSNNTATRTTKGTATYTCTACSYSYTSASDSEIVADIKNITAGSSSFVRIDGIPFCVIKKEHNRAFLLMRGVDPTPVVFDRSSNRWMNSSVRTYLNETWLNSNTELKAVAQKTTIYTRRPDNSTEYDATEDTIFLLTEADIFGTANGQPANTQDYTTGTRLVIPDDLYRIGNYPWFLRSPSGYDSYTTLCIDERGTLGKIYRGNTCLIRPACWVDLS